jgi:hypothetical protein
LESRRNAIEAYLTAAVQQGAEPAAAYVQAYRGLDHWSRLTFRVGKLHYFVYCSTFFALEIILRKPHWIVLFGRDFWSHTFCARKIPDNI